MIKEYDDEGEPQSERNLRMTIQVKDTDPIEAMRATLRVETAEVVDSKYPDERTGAKKRQFATELKVLSGAGERNGETFNEWFAFVPSQSLTTASKTGELVRSALGKAGKAESFEELANKLVGKTFCAKLVRSGEAEDGPYTRVKHKTIGPATGEDNDSGPASGAGRDEEDPEEDFDAIPL
ncbi:MAG: hypothetical protein M3426_01950 [Actinomycetota bacterium]|nr:hypothetical protein [Actinomycetota bacterium]